MTAVTPVTSRALAAAATRRIASSSVAPVPFRYERSASRSGAGGAAAFALRPAPSSLRRQRPGAARVSPIQHAICSGSDR